MPTARYSRPMDLYAAYLGGPLDDGRMGEGHEVVLVVAADRAEAEARAVAKWQGAPPGHLDALERIVRVDGYEVTLTRQREAATARRRPRRDGDVQLSERNVLGGELEPCGTDPLTGFYRDGCCSTGPDDLGSHTVCAVVTPSSSTTSARSATTCRRRCRSTGSPAWCPATGGA